MAVTADRAYPEAMVAELERLARACYPCYQCGTCSSSCPSGRELHSGPRRLVRLILSGEIEAVLRSDDLWRCTECGTCTEVCRMEIDVATVLHGLRDLEREYGSAIHCPERSAADIATTRLRRRPRIDTMKFGAAMVAKGHLPKDKVGAAGMGMKLARQMLPAGRKGRAGEAAPAAAVALPFYAGCALQQDHELLACVREVAAGFGVRLEEAADAACCGHPSRGAVPARFGAGERVYTACPACDASLAETGVEVTPLWDALTARARRGEAGIAAAAPGFVPYVGCLADRDAALAALGDAAELSGAAVHTDYPTLHSGCCGALGGVYRGATKASAMLLEFAAARHAPVVTPCSLCRDNLRSAARELKRDVPVHYWPEFFRAVPIAPEARPDD